MHRRLTHKFQRSRDDNFGRINRSGRLHSDSFLSSLDREEDEGFRSFEPTAAPKPSTHLSAAFSFRRAVFRYCSEYSDNSE